MRGVLIVVIASLTLGLALRSMRAQPRSDNPTRPAVGSSSPRAVMAESRGSSAGKDPFAVALVEATKAALREAAGGLHRYFVEIGHYPLFITDLQDEHARSDLKSLPPDPCTGYPFGASPGATYDRNGNPATDYILRTNWAATGAGARCFAANNNANILYVDGGLQSTRSFDLYSLLAHPRASWLRAIQMFDLQTGWAIHAQKYGQGLAGRMGSSIVRTTDGGIHWMDVRPAELTTRRVPSVSFVFGPSISLVYGLTSRIAWVVAAPDPFHVKMLHTIDGGQTWNSVTLANFYITSLHFINPLDGWLIGKDDDVYRSTDGGATWFKVAGAKFFRHTLGISFLNAARGWIAGIGDAHDKIYHLWTVDGGRTWTPQASPLPRRQTSPSFVMAGVPQFFTAQDGIFLARYGDYNDFAALVFVTHDGGITWTSTAPLTGLQSLSSPASFADVNHGWIGESVAKITDAHDGMLTGDFYGVLYATSDGGRHWATIRPAGFFFSPERLDFITPEVGWALGDWRAPWPSSADRSGIYPQLLKTSPPLLQTKNGGVTWGTPQWPMN